MVAITREKEYTCDDVVREHLPVIFPTLLYVYDQYLLKPECVLYKYVPLRRRCYVSSWPIRPEIS